MKTHSFFIPESEVEMVLEAARWMEVCAPWMELLVAKASKNNVSKFVFRRNYLEILLLFTQSIQNLLNRGLPRKFIADITPGETGIGRELGSNIYRPSSVLHTPLFIKI